MAEISQKFRRKLEKKREQLSKRGGGKIPFFLVKDGTTRVRLLPAPDEEEFAVEATFFFISKEIGSVISPMTFGEPCPIMEAYEKLKNSTDEGDREMAKKIQPKKRYFAMCYKYSDEKGKTVDVESGTKLIMLTNGLYQSIIDYYLDEEYGDMTDESTGYDLKLKRTGKGLTDTEYSAIACKPTPMSKKFRGKIYDPIKEVKKIIPSYEDIQDILKQIGISTGVKKKKKKSKFRK